MAGQKILILDDDPEIATLFALTLRQLGHEVSVCTRFEDARLQLTRACPDALLTDIRVGEYNGMQLAHLFRHRSPNGPLVVVTAYDDVVLQKEVKGLEGDYLVKPVSLGKLRAAFSPIKTASTDITKMPRVVIDAEASAFRPRARAR